MIEWPRMLLSTLLLAGLCAHLPVSAASEDTTADAYAMPGQLVRLADGRALNLRCGGDGARVVVLEAGGNADSSTWFRVQPRLASHARVCAYDRAGYGFSDEGPRPRDLDAVVADLNALIAAAGLPLPAILVGHSLGSNIVRRYAQLHPSEVAGLVLVDPPEQGADDQMPAAWQAEAAAGIAQRDAFIDGCEAAAEANDVETIQERCLRAPPPWMSERVAAAMKRNKSRPAYWRTLRSELEQNIGIYSAPVPVDESYGSIPLVLLQAPDQVDDAPDDVRRVIAAARRQTNARILAASTQGVAIEVRESSHDIQLDRPEAVVAAVRRLLDASTETPAAGD